MSMNMREKFSSILSAAPFYDLIQNTNSIAVAVSGGADSMALCSLLAELQTNTPQFSHISIHALTVDHRLRVEAAQEARFVGKTVQQWGIKHQTLVWDHQDKPASRIQESARDARYMLMEEYCKANGIQHLFVAHHANDQAETFMFRLAKGSGIDGLAGMRPVQPRGAITLCRPLLNIEKDELLQYCADQKIPYVDDPSNQAMEYARVRMRASMAALESEGLTIKRLEKLASRMDRASSALNQLSEMYYKNVVLEKNTIRSVLNFNALLELPDELVFRIIKMSIEELCPKDGYGTRTDRIENLVQEIVGNKDFKARTLGGVKFSKKDNCLMLELENMPKA